MPARKTDSNDEGIFVVRMITAFPGGRFLETRTIRYTSRSTAYAECDRMQDQFDADCDPVRVYVTDQERLPIRAGRTAHLPANWFFTKFDRQYRKGKAA